MSARLLTVALRNEHDVVVARQRARQLARHLGFEAQDQARIATAVSEIARNAVQYGGNGGATFTLEGRTAPQTLAICVSDSGPGIAQLGLVLSGQYRSETGMGMGLVGARRLMDQFHVESSRGQGTSVHLRKFLPRSVAALDGARVGAVVSALAREGLQNPLAEVQQQNQELLQALEELRQRQDELIQLNRELEDTNRGVVALYAELDEKAEHLRRADEMKTRFLSNMSHEFRTPLNSILAIAGLLQRRSDGPLSPDQEKQVGFISSAAQDLTEIVDDLLDIAKVEAGKTVMRVEEFPLTRVFSALRGLLRPLLVSDRVHLVLEEPKDIPLLYSDEGKLSQVLRNLISNALKFTESGEVRVRAAVVHAGRVQISVSDTGMGIAPSDLARIFEEFGQVEHATQRKVKGTGLGLALSRKLAEVLGGTLGVTSIVGQGSTFMLELPLSLAPPVQVPDSVSRTNQELPASAARRVLVVDDDEASRYVLCSLAAELGFATFEATSGADGLTQALAQPPSALLLDLMMPGMNGDEVLRRLRSSPATAHLPVVLATSKVLDASERAELDRLGAAVFPKTETAGAAATALLADALSRARAIAVAERDSSIAG